MKKGEILVCLFCIMFIAVSSVWGEFEGVRAKSNITSAVVSLKQNASNYAKLLTTQRDEIERQVLVNPSLIDTGDKTKLSALKNDITTAINSLNTVSDSITSKWSNLE